jgi:hypothetical protein
VTRDVAVPDVPGDGVRLDPDLASFEPIPVRNVTHDDVVVTLVIMMLEVLAVAVIVVFDRSRRRAPIFLTIRSAAARGQDCCAQQDSRRDVFVSRFHGLLGPAAPTSTRRSELRLAPELPFGPG